MPLDMELGIGPGDFVLDGDPAPLPKKGAEPPQFSAHMLTVANGWMDQDSTWHGGRPQPSGLCVRWEPNPPKFSAQVYYSYCDFVRTLHRCKALLACSSSSSKFSILCILFLESLIVLSLCAMHSCATAPIAVANYIAFYIVNFVSGERTLKGANG